MSVEAEDWSWLKTDEDSTLVHRAKRGHAPAWGELYDRHAPALQGLAVRMLRDTSAAEDLVHDVFVEAWRAIESYTADRGTVRAWLITRLRSRALDRLRSRARMRLADDAESLEIAAESVDPSHPVDAARVRAWVAELPETQRQALTYAYFEGLSMQQIAEAQGVPVGTAKARVSRAVAKLRAARGGEA